MGKHHVIIGSGITGTQAATTLRQRDPESKITIITMSSLLLYNRYDVHKIFSGTHDWRDFLVYQPSYYEENNITMKRNSEVVFVDSAKQIITFKHKEVLHYDTLLIASGVAGCLPEEFADFSSMVNFITSFEKVMAIYNKLPENGHAILLGGDMLGLDFARKIIKNGYKVTLVTISDDYTFWPHNPDADKQKLLIEALEKLGVEIVESGGIADISESDDGIRTVKFKNGGEISGDVVISSFGLAPSVEFMLGSDVGIERGIMVDPKLKTANDNIWAAGDACQIWSEEENGYRFFYGWKNVRAMGELVARNMTGDDESFVSAQDESIRQDSDGNILSPFWEYN